MTVNANVKKKRLPLRVSAEAADSLMHVWESLGDYTSDPDFAESLWKIVELPCMAAVMDLNGAGAVADPETVAYIVYISRMETTFNASYGTVRIHLVVDGSWIAVEDMEREQDGIILTLDLREGNDITEGLA